MKNLVKVEQIEFEAVKARATAENPGFDASWSHSEKLPAPRRVKLLGAAVDDVLMSEAVSHIALWSKQFRQDPALQPLQVVTLNPEYLTMAQRDEELLSIINQAGLVTPDGIGLWYASRLIRRPLRGRVTGVELTRMLARHSARLTATGEGELRLFLLGAAPGIAEEAARKLEEAYPGVVIAGTFAGNSSPAGDAETIERVREARADVVLVAYGMGKQDRWIVRNLKASGAAVGIGIGGTFDYLAGRVPNPPEVIKKFGMEWAYRIFTQKGRWKRAHFVPRFIMTVAMAAPLYWLGEQASANGPADAGY